MQVYLEQLKVHVSLAAPNVEENSEVVCSHEVDVKFHTPNLRIFSRDISEKQIVYGRLMSPELVNSEDEQGMLFPPLMMG